MANIRLDYVLSVDITRSQKNELWLKQYYNNNDNIQLQIDYFQFTGYYFRNHNVLYSGMCIIRDSKWYVHCFHNISFHRYCPINIDNAYNNTS